MGCRGEREIVFARVALGSAEGAKHLKNQNLAMEAVAKKDAAGRLRTLATELSLNSDKTWLLRRAKQLERDARTLELQVAARQSRDERSASQPL